MRSFATRAFGRAPAALIAVYLLMGNAVAQPTDPAGLAEDRIYEGEAATIEALAKAGNAARALAETDAALARHPLPTRPRAALLTTRARQLIALGHEKDALEPLETATRIEPDDGDLRLLLAWLQLRLDDLEGAAATITVLADQGHHKIDALDAAYFGELQSRLQRANKLDVMFSLDLAVAHAGYDGGWGIGWKNQLAAIAVRGLVDRARSDEALAVLATVIDPTELQSLLVDRRYAVLWPAIEARIRSDFRKIETGWVGATQMDHAQNPLDLKRLTLASAALRNAGRPSEAIALVQPFAGGLARAQAALGGKRDIAPRDYMWAINDLAWAFMQKGQIDEADQQYADLFKLDIVKVPDLINIVINRAMLLLQADQPERALQAIEESRRGREGVANATGAVFIAEVRVCALHALGRDAETAKPLETLIAGRDDNWDAYTQTMLCLDRLDDAEAAVLARLADPRQRAGMLTELQPVRHETPLKQEARQRARIARIAMRPGVAASLTRFGRILPVALRPTQQYRG